MAEIGPEDAIALIGLIESAGIQLWIDGGWAVDALLGKHTRPHRDLDIVVAQSDVARLRNHLTKSGFAEIERDDSSAWNFVLSDTVGREIDVHAIVPDDSGNGLYGPPELGVMYPAGSLEGFGSILNRRVQCIAPAFLVQFHTGYTLRPEDFQDVSALCDRFNIALPPEYAGLIQQRPHRM